MTLLRSQVNKKNLMMNLFNITNKRDRFFCHNKDSNFLFSWETFDVISDFQYQCCRVSWFRLHILSFNLQRNNLTRYKKTWIYWLQLVKLGFIATESNSNSIWCSESINKSKIKNVKRIPNLRSNYSKFSLFWVKQTFFLTWRSTSDRPFTFLRLRNLNTGQKSVRRKYFSIANFFRDFMKYILENNIFTISFELSFQY